MGERLASPLAPGQPARASTSAVGRAVVGRGVGLAVLGLVEAVLQALGHGQVLLHRRGGLCGEALLRSSILLCRSCGKAVGGLTLVPESASVFFSASVVLVCALIISSANFFTAA